MSTNDQQNDAGTRRRKELFWPWAFVVVCLVFLALGAFIFLFVKRVSLGEDSATPENESAGLVLRVTGLDGPSAPLPPGSS